MSDDRFPSPNSDPEAQGLPEVADDDSFADVEKPTSREADGRNPAALPGDRDEFVAAEDYGVTQDEESRNEPLDARLSREEPEVSATGRPVDDYGTVGRIVEPDEGAHTDVDKEMIASDAGVAGGGATAEELAMHLEPEPREWAPDDLRR